jgi:hypothetical protein
VGMGDGWGRESQSSLISKETSTLFSSSLLSSKKKVAIIPSHCFSVAPVFGNFFFFFFSVFNILPFYFTK